MKKLIVRKVFAYALLSVFLTSSIFLASCKNAVDGGVGSGGGGGGTPASAGNTPGTNPSGNNAPLYYENPVTGTKTPLNLTGTPTNIPFKDIKDKLAHAKFWGHGL